MEESLRTAAAGLLLCLAAARAAAQEGPAKWLEDFEKRFPPVEKNAAAEELERLSLALGLDPYGEAGDQHPLPEDLEAYRQAAFGTWLDAQVKTPDDSIGAPPPKLAEFLDTRQATVWRMVTLLGHEVPQWSFGIRKAPRRRHELLIIVSVGRILLSAALLEERAGHRAQAANLLEASWSMSRSAAVQPELICQLIAVALMKLQAGALRKMSEPALEWIERMSGEVPKEAMLDAIQNEPLVGPAASGETTVGPSDAAWMRGWRASTDNLRKLSACEISNRPSEEIWKPLTEEIAREKAAGGGSELEVMQEIAMPNLTNAFRRVARVIVDCELTAKILELRSERAASRLSRWPEKFFDSESRACPGVTYEYRSSGAAMSLRFAGSVGDSGAPLVLPLSFDARAPRPTPAPSRTPRPTATPRASSLTPSRAGA